jgi:mRNA interferase MazF
MVITQGEVWWAELPPATGVTPGRARPVVIIQGDALNNSKIATVVCVPLTSNLKWGEAPGNVQLSSKSTGLPKSSVANVSKIVALEKTYLVKRLGKLSHSKLERLFAGIDLVLGR